MDRFFKNINQKANLGWGPMSDTHLPGHHYFKEWIFEKPVQKWMIGDLVGTHEISCVSFVYLWWKWTCSTRTCARWRWKPTFWHVHNSVRQNILKKKNDKTYLLHILWTPWGQSLFCFFLTLGLQEFFKEGCSSEGIKSKNLKTLGVDKMIFEQKYMRKCDTCISAPCRIFPDLHFYSSLPPPTPPSPNIVLEP